MIKIKANEACPFRATAVTIGKFDGVHRGHDALLSALEKNAPEGAAKVVMAIDMTPQRILTGEEREVVLEKKGIDAVAEMPFTGTLAGMTAEAFVKEILAGKMNIRALVCGEDFRFGRERSGDVTLLRKMGDELGFSVTAVADVTAEGERISSTRIREALRTGDIETVNELLGFDYPVKGEVIHGQMLGRTIGFPTMNQIPPAEKLLPPNGVYCSRTLIDGQMHDGITNIGMRPTVNGSFISVETHLPDFSADLYGKTGTVFLKHFLRPERKFPDVGSLKQRIAEDVREAMLYFGS